MSKTLLGLQPHASPRPRHDTLVGVAPPSNPPPDPLERPARELSLPDIRAALHELTTEALVALNSPQPRQLDLQRARSLLRDIQLLGRAIRRYELK